MLRSIRQSAKEALLRWRPAMFWWYVQARHGDLEPEMALLPRLCKRGHTAIDIGANYGVYSHLMLKYSGRCVAFEPYPRLAEILRAGYKGRLEVHQVALSDRSGTTRMRTSPLESGMGTIEPSNRIEQMVRNEAGLVTFDVPVRRLDDFDIDQVAFVKIDVQGHEREVLVGGARTISVNRPSMLIELEDRQRPGAREWVIRHLSDLGYAAFFLYAHRLMPAVQFVPSVHQNVADMQNYIRNFIFLPADRLDEFANDMG